MWPTAKPGRVLETPDWSDSRNYPKDAQRKNQEGSVFAELLIGVSGKPEACRILKSSNFVELDVGTCALMMKIRFEPARDSQGTAIQSHLARDVIWLLTDPRPFASSALRARLNIKDGHQESCEIADGDGPYVIAWGALACRLLTDLPYYFGSHAGDTASATVEFRLNAGDHAAALDAPWPPGAPIAAEKLSFTVDGEGYANPCMPVEHTGFGPHDVADTACGTLLNILEFSLPAREETPLRGTFETRVYLSRDDADAKP